METKPGQHCKIRKRANSSSSSSSLIRKYRSKRVIVTPIRTRIVSSKSPGMDVTDGKEVSVSARKLAANLWEINTVNAPQTVAKSTQSVEEELLCEEKLFRPPHLPDPSFTPERVDGSNGNRSKRRTSAVKTKLVAADDDIGGLESAGNSIMKSKSKRHTKCMIGVMKDVSSGLATSKELLKVLNHTCGFDKKQSSGTSLILALQVELDRACAQVNEVIKEQLKNRSDIEYLVKCFIDEKASWKIRERERTHRAMACIAKELEIERKLRRQTERLNKKLGKELVETKALMSSAMKELASEKRAKEILEQVCDELAKGVGEDKAEAEQLKEESAKVREELEKERQMLQLAEVLREERVQMKLSEAKYQFEEKNAAVEKLISELEGYLKEKVSKENEDDDESPSHERIKELKAYLKEIKLGSCQIGNEEDADACPNGEVYDGDESVDSDFHSIELNMDSKIGSFKWSFDCDALENPRRVSVEKVFKGRNSIDNNIQWTSISFHKGNDIHMEFDTKNIENSVAFDNDNEKQLTEPQPEPKSTAELAPEPEPKPELGIQSQKTHDRDGEVKKDRVLRTLRDHLIFGSKRGSNSIHDYASPTRE